MHETADSVTTPLWGIWEFWCDFQTKGPTFASADGASPNHGSPQHGGAGGHQPSSSWLDNIKSCGVIDTVEGFWGIHECMLSPSALPGATNYYLFRHNVAPLWEHEGNRRGGKWVCQLDRPEVVDALWCEVCLMLIGELQTVPETEICGCVVSKKKGVFKVSVWTRHSDDESSQLKIGHAFKEAIARATADQKDLKPVPVVYMRHCGGAPHAQGGATSPGKTPTAARDDKRVFPSILYTLP